METKNKQRASWELSEEQKKKINQKEIPQTNNDTYREKIGLLTREYSKKLESYSKENIDNALDFLQRRRENHGGGGIDACRGATVFALHECQREKGKLHQRPFESGKGVHSILLR